MERDKIPAQIHALSDVQSQQVGEGTKIWQFVVVLPGARIGDGCNINAQVFIENDVRVGNNVTVKCGVQLWDGITLEDDVFIGPNVTFTHGRGGVTIGRSAMIGAGSLVLCDVPDGELWFGSPAVSRGRAPAPAA